MSASSSLPADPTEPARRILAETVPREALRGLMARDNRRASLQLAAHLAVLAAGQVWIATSLGSWMLWPAMFLTGIVMVHLFAPQHECSHFSAFRSRPANLIVSWLCGLVIIVPQLHFRYEHTDHHTWTNLTGRDPELIPMPKSLWGYLAYVSGLPYWWGGISGIARRALGRLNEEELRFTPATHQPRLVLEARVMGLVYLALLCALVLGSTWLLWHWLLPLLLGQPVMRYIRMTEHVGRPDVRDPLQNTRSTAVAAPWRWLAWNMNFHAEHHIAPSMPFHALPGLQQLLGQKLPQRQGYRQGHWEILRQLFGRG